MKPKRTGLTRLWRYTEGRRRRLSVVLALAAVSAAAPVAMWHIVGDAIDNGIVAERHGPPRPRTSSPTWRSASSHGCSARRRG